MKIVLPENKSEITLSQYQRYADLINSNKTDLEKLVGTACIFTKVTKQQAENMTYADLVDVSNYISLAVSKNYPFQHRFKIGDIEFGFITLDKMKGKEYLDLVNYSKDIENVTNYHKIVAILFRPITNTSVGNTYEVEEYKGTEKYSELMRQTPLSIVDGMLGFFLTLRKELGTYFQKCIKEEQAKAERHEDTLRNGVGSLV